MKCEFCRFAPPVNADGYQDECSLFDLYGTIWKDGKEGCTMSYQTLAKNVLNTIRIRDLKKIGKDMPKRYIECRG